MLSGDRLAAESLPKLRRLLPQLDPDLEGLRRRRPEREPFGDLHLDRARALIFRSARRRARPSAPQSRHRARIRDPLSISALLERAMEAAQFAQRALGVLQGVEFQDPLELSRVFLFEGGRREGPGHQDPIPRCAQDVHNVSLRRAFGLSQLLTQSRFQALQLGFADALRSQLRAQAQDRFFLRPSAHR